MGDKYIEVTFELTNEAVAALAKIIADIRKYGLIAYDFDPPWWMGIAGRGEWRGYGA
jgi:hypothetical protein